MLLGPVSLLDCLVFVLFLIPQLLIDVRVFDLFVCVTKTLPFLVIQLPYQFVQERFLTPYRSRSPFTRHASTFKDVVIRCVRFTFANMPPHIGRVFFSKAVALPFIRFRMFRNGVFRSPFCWKEVDNDGFKGIWICEDNSQQPDVVLLYCHGGGFAMGSSYFYLEYLIVLCFLLKEEGFMSPAVFASEYSLVPDEVWPVQLRQIAAAYRFLLDIMGDSSKICLAGDSAGGTLVLSLLLHLSSFDEYSTIRPGLACLVSPWVRLISDLDRDTESDFLDLTTLQLFATNYAGERVNESVVSPGSCRDDERWRRAAPSYGFQFLFGAEEVFAPEIRSLVTFLSRANIFVDVWEEPNGIHAWPVIAMFLDDTDAQRLAGVRRIARVIKSNLAVKQ